MLVLIKVSFNVLRLISSIVSNDTQHRSVISLLIAFPTLVCRPKIVEGRLNKIRSQKALLEQPFIKDTSSSVAEHIKAAVANLGENIQVRVCWLMPYGCMYLNVHSALSCYIEGSAH